MDPHEESKAALKNMQTAGAATYLSAYIQLMALELGLGFKPIEELRDMIVSMVDPLNDATEAIFRAMMKDDGVEETIQKFRARLEAI